MNYIFTAKQLGERWYLDIKHDNPNDIAFNDKLNKVFSILDKQKTGTLKIYLTESYSIIQDNTVFIDDYDISNYFTTNNDMEIHFIVYDREYSISSDMYGLLEYLFNPNFHKYVYTVEICN